MKKKILQLLDLSILILKLVKLLYLLYYTMLIEFLNIIYYELDEEKDITTVFQYHNKSIAYIFNNDEDISFPLSTWLELANISLEEKNPYFDSMNTYRFTGVNLFIKLNYNNDINPKDINYIGYDNEKGSIIIHVYNIILNRR